MEKFTQADVPAALRVLRRLGLTLDDNLGAKFANAILFCRLYSEITEKLNLPVGQDTAHLLVPLFRVLYRSGEVLRQEIEKNFVDENVSAKLLSDYFLRMGDSPNAKILLEYKPLGKKRAIEHWTSVFIARIMTEMFSRLKKHVQEQIESPDDDREEWGDYPEVPEYEYSHVP